MIQQEQDIDEQIQFLENKCEEVSQAKIYHKQQNKKAAKDCLIRKRDYQSQLDQLYQRKGINNPSQFPNHENQCEVNDYLELDQILNSVTHFFEDVFGLHSCLVFSTLYIFICKLRSFIVQHICLSQG